MLSRSELRIQLRARRGALSVADQRRASRYIFSCFEKHLGRPLHMAGYWPLDGEVDVRSLAQSSHRRIFYLPCLDTHRSGYLYFKPWSSKERTHLNRLSIPEPYRGCPRLAWRLDIILLPLVGFDSSGHRLGMGGGYYDRSLADLPRRPKRPWLIGVAHDDQEVDILPAESWDWPLDAVITGSRWLRIRTHKY